MIDMVKKLLVIALCASLSVGFCACSEIGLEKSEDVNSVGNSAGTSPSDNISDFESVGSEQDHPKHESSYDEKSEDTSDMNTESTVVDDSRAESDIDDQTKDTSDVIIDNSSTEVPSNGTDGKGYAITLSKEELDAINAGKNGEYMILVNKENVLPDSYVPENLVDIRDTRKDRAPEKMVKTAEIALHAFLKEAAANGYGDVTITSGYRSIEKQQSLFNMYVNQEMAKGKDRDSAIAAASVYSAYPGTSEHHTGLCADMHNLPAASQNFGYTDEAKWLAANAHRFGFILRFPQGKEDVTTYMWEPWHFRFVGIHYATEIYESGLCLEEYLAQHNPSKEVNG